MRTVLKSVGNFVELGCDDHPDAPSLAMVRGRRTEANRDRVVRYLRGGRTLVYSPGRDEDVLDASKTAGSASIATKGVHVPLELPDPLSQLLSAGMRVDPAQRPTLRVFLDALAK